MSKWSTLKPMRYQIYVSALLCLVACSPSVSGRDAGPGGDLDSGAFDANVRDTTGDTSEDTARRDSGPRPDGGASDESCEKMDILFVVDDSGSMAEEQRNLASNFPMFVNILNAYETASARNLDYRLAVTTTSMDYVLNLTYLVNGSAQRQEVVPVNPQNGSFVSSASCGVSSWINSTDSDVASKFACVADVGVEGGGFEMPLLAVERAVAADGPNPGFLRDDALLAVVILTDEDDCSVHRTTASLDVGEVASGCSNEACIEREIRSRLDAWAGDCQGRSDSVQSFIASIDTAAGGRERWAGAVIAGPNDCTSAFGEAADGRRLREFVSESGDNVVFSSICEGDLAGALGTALDTFTAACEDFGPLI